jgi:4-hydroxy-tetrahydrodipicolinate reductase
MMKIALIGYGKMGKTIEQLAVEAGHQIVLKIGKENKAELNAENIKKADVAIEFSTPETAFANVSFCLQHQVPTVCGTTAWLQHLPKAEQMAMDNNTGFIYASNFSIGVNLFFAFNKHLAKIMTNYPQYSVGLEEIHHTQKLDAPSGTAVTLAEGILDQYPTKNTWVNHASTKPNELQIISKRIDPAPGTHSVLYNSEIDSIAITHTAHNRIGFASGALVAAAFLQNKKGIFTMQDVLGL